MKIQDIVVGAFVYTAFVSLRAEFSHGFFAFMVFALFNYGKFCAVVVTVVSLNLNRSVTYFLILLNLPILIALFILFTAAQTMELSEYVGSTWFYELLKIVMFSIGGTIAALVCLEYLNRRRKKHTLSNLVEEHNH